MALLLGDYALSLWPCNFVMAGLRNAAAERQAEVKDIGYGSGKTGTEEAWRFPYFCH